MTIGQERLGGFLKMPSEVPGRAVGVQTGRCQGRGGDTFQAQGATRESPAKQQVLDVSHFLGVQPKAVNLDKSGNKQYE